jgi:hypothetical protein
MLLIITVDGTAFAGRMKFRMRMSCVSTLISRRHSIKTAGCRRGCWGVNGRVNLDSYRAARTARVLARAVHVGLRATPTAADNVMAIGMSTHQNR